jgi:hypothetical protein
MDIVVLNSNDFSAETVKKKDVLFYDTRGRG